MPAAHIEPQIVPPEQAEIISGSMPASAKACRTPISDTQAPAPPPAISATRLPSKPSRGRACIGGRTAAPTGSAWSTSGNGNSARRARRRKAGSSVARASSVRSRSRPNPRSTL
jgi:hypothetical protein